MIRVENLCKSYGSVQAVKNLSFEVNPGEIVGFLGPNGAGKSTALRMLAGFLGMTSGTIEVGGFDITSQSEQARAQIGYMPESVPLYTEMRVEEYLRFRAELKGVKSKERKSAVTSAMADAALTHMKDVLIGKLSKGYRQRVGLADALVARPPLLILDEPTAGLDPNQIREVRDLIGALGEKHTLVLSTHILPEVESTCSRAIVIAKGTLVAQGPLHELRAGKQGRELRLRLRPNGDSEPSVKELLSEFGKLQATPKTESGAGTYRLRLDSTEDQEQKLETLVAKLCADGHGVQELTFEKASLDDIFAQLTLEDDAGEDS